VDTVLGFGTGAVERSGGVILPVGVAQEDGAEEAPGRRHAEGVGKRDLTSEIAEDAGPETGPDEDAGDTRPARVAADATAGGVTAGKPEDEASSPGAGSD